MSHSSSCIFCQVIEGKIPAKKYYEDSNFLCIQDIRPQAKIHLLLMPKKHIPTLADAFPEKSDGEGALIGEMFRVATQIAREQNLLPAGFRSVINTQEQAGQTVFHIHLHLLGGEPLRGTFG